MPQQIDEVARVYATSLFELAEKEGGIDRAQEVGAELEALAEATREDRRFGEFLRSPVIDGVDRERSLRTILEGRVSELLMRFVVVLNRKGRAGELAAIEQAYDLLLQERLGKVEVDVWTAGPIGDRELGTIRSRVTSALGKDAVVHQYVDPTMIGGIRLRVGDQLIDGSVAAKLRAIRSHIIETGGGDVRARFQQFL